MAKQRVLLVSSQDLFGEGMEQVLRAAKDIELIGSWRLDEDIGARIAVARPHVVVIADESVHAHNSAGLTASLVEQHPEVIVIRVNPTEDTLRIVSTHTVPARVANLLQAIHTVPEITQDPVLEEPFIPLEGGK